MYLSLQYHRDLEQVQSNPQQRDAVDSDTHTVCLAGPGSGKTRTLTMKLARTASTRLKPPHRLACITYSNECVREISRRLRVYGLAGSPSIWVGTLHSFAFTEVVRPFARHFLPGLPPSLGIAADEKSDSLFQAALRSCGIVGKPIEWRTLVSQHRLSDYVGRAAGVKYSKQSADIANAYQAQLRAHGLIDYDDIVVAAAQLVCEQPLVRRLVAAKFPYLMVDEYQDLGVPLDDMVRALAFDAGATLFAVGDPDQSIYGFSGADPVRLRSLAGRPEVTSITLLVNYRSTSPLVSLGAVAIGHDLPYRSARVGASHIVARQVAGCLPGQARYVAETVVRDVAARLPNFRFGDLAVLYPTRFEGSTVAAAMAGAGIPFLRNDSGREYDRTVLNRWLEDAAKWTLHGGWKCDITWRELLLRFRALYRLAVPVSLSYQIDHLVAPFLWKYRGSNPQLSDWLMSFQEAVPQFLQALRSTDPSMRKGIDVLSSLAAPTGGWGSARLERLAYQGGDPQAVTLSTLHGAKGLEFRAVVLVGLDQGVLPSWGATTAASLSEAQRLFFVGVTRASECLYLICTGSRLLPWGGVRTEGISPFLAALLPHIPDQARV